MFSVAARHRRRRTFVIYGGLVIRICFYSPFFFFHTYMYILSSYPSVNILSTLFYARTPIVPVINDVPMTK